MKASDVPQGCEVVDKDTSIPSWAVHSCGTLGGPGGDAEVLEMFVNVVCSVCGHTPCPCCGDWCDQMIANADESDVDPCQCFDDRCSYPEPLRWVARRTGKTVDEVDDEVLADCEH